MPTVDELMATGKTQLGAALDAGVSILSLDQTVTFTRYIRLVLPLDGFVYWVRADLVSRGATLGASIYGGADYGQSPRIISNAKTLTVRGSLHYATDQQQNSDESPAVNHVRFSALEPVQDFNQISPNELYIADFQGMKFAFTARRSFYVQADLHHYFGNAVYPAMASQIVDSLPALDTQNAVVSNSMPFWLALNAVVPVYPAYLVPANLPPPYATVEVNPERTEALTAAPFIASDSSHSQLTFDTVKITVYGLRNFNAMDYLDYLYSYFELHAEDTDGRAMGLSNMPVVRDEIRTQSELNVIAMKKSVTFVVNYYQRAARNIARQLIQSAIVDVS